MATGFSSMAAGVGAPAAASASQPLKLVQQALASKNNIQITLPDMGDLIVLSGRGEYHSSVQDISGFSIASADSFEVRNLNDAESNAIPASGKDIRDLLWELAFHAHEHTLIADCSENDVIQFNRWPNLTRLSGTPNTARICALLTRNPTSITLVRRVLGIDRNEVNQVISAAYSAGIVNTISRGPSMAQPEPTAAETKPDTLQKPGLWNSLFTKISSL